MSVEYRLIDRTRKEAHQLGKGSSWSIIPKDAWKTEWSLVLALLQWRKARRLDRSIFNRVLRDANHVWSVTRGFAPYYNRSCLDHLIIFSDHFGSGLENVPHEWPTVWTAYVHDDECRAWADGHYGPGFFDVYWVMTS